MTILSYKLSTSTLLPTMIPFFVSPFSESVSSPIPLLAVVQISVLFSTLATLPILPSSTSPLLCASINSNGALLLPFFPLRGVLELASLVEPKMEGANAARKVRTMGRLALMIAMQGSSVVQKRPMGRVKVGSVKEITWRDLMRIILIIVILSYVSFWREEGIVKGKTYKTPKLNISTNPIFLLVAKCSFKICGIGNSITIKSVTTFKLPALTYTVFLAPHTPPGIVLSQLKASGRQRRNVSRTMDMAHMTRIDIAT
jgi:hypothetical protein